MDLRELAGRVIGFDRERGLGEVLGVDGRRFPFHAASIADGTRRIAVEAEVIFNVGPGPGGRWEAVRIERAPVDSD